MGTLASPEDNDWALRLAETSQRACRTRIVYPLTRGAHRSDADAQLSGINAILLNRILLQLRCG
jgi:hypothetical protein